MPIRSNVDLTGGAPESIRVPLALALAARREQGLQVIDRCNLTIPQRARYEGWPFLAEHQVRRVRIPCPAIHGDTSTNQRWAMGVFVRSIEGLQMLKQAGYGQPAATWN